MSNKRRSLNQWVHLLNGHRSEKAQCVLSSSLPTAGARMLPWVGATSIMRSFIKMIIHHSFYKRNGSPVSRSCWLFSLPHTPTLLRSVSFQPLSTTSSAGLLQADQHAQQMLFHQADQHACYGQSRSFPSHYLGCNVLGEFEYKNNTLISEVCQLVVLSLFFSHHDMPGRKCPRICHFLISDSCLLPTA